MANAAIDMWAPILPVPEMMAHLRDNFPDLMLGYLRVFWKQQPTQEAVRARAESAAQPLDRVMAAIDAAGIGKTLITGFDEASTAGKTFVPNEIVAGIAARHPDRFLPFVGATSCAAPTRSATSSTGSASGASADCRSGRS
jgi:hypothetical protein